MTATRLTMALAVAALALGAAGRPAVGQTSGDDELEKLLRKVESSPPADAPKTEADRTKPGGGEVAPEDRDLDSLLEKLGETPDRPDAKGKAAPGPDGPKPPEPADPAGEKLGEKEKKLDKHLEGLTGRKKKKEQEEQQGGGPGDDSSPLKDAIKKMDDVRKRLSETDTGEATRKTQGEIVKELDQILEQIRRRRGGGSQTRMVRRNRPSGQQGEQPGQGEEPNNTGAGVGASKPKAPGASPIAAGGKDTWGDLPPSLREELENVFKTEMLPAKRDLIMRYYSSVARKSRAREEGRR